MPRPHTLLVNPWICDFKAFDFWNKPMGLLMVASLLERLGHTIDLIDCMDRQSRYFVTPTETDIWGRGKYLYEVIEKPPLFRDIPRRYKRYGMPRRIFIDTLERVRRPDHILVTSAMTYWYPGVFEAIRILRRRFPGVKIILGGIYATLCADHARTYSGADIVLPGAVEERIPDLLAALDHGGPVPRGLEHCRADHALYARMHYGVVMTSRGCPFDCTYCATKILCGAYRALPVKDVIEQIDLVAGKTRNIAFFDDALLYNRSLTDLLRMIAGRAGDLDLHASNGLHCRYVTEEIARLMARAGFKTIYLSLETTDPLVQHRTGGKVSTEEFTAAVQELCRAGFRPGQIHAYLLYGMPGQGHEEILDSIDLCHGLGVNPHLCEFSPIPHTAEYARTGFDESTDPLCHNNLFFTWYYRGTGDRPYRMLKDRLSRRPAGPRGRS